MISVKNCIFNDLQKAIQTVYPTLSNVDPVLKATQDPKFGDYQANFAMALAKKLNLKPREIAEAVAQHLSSNYFSKIEVAGPGFINLWLDSQFIISKLAELVQDERLGVASVSEPKQHVVDFSSVNLAKEMHIGHLRTTVTGEVICRVLEFIGHPVERVNHVGDWGTPFGMLLELISQNYPQVLNQPDSFHVHDLETFYKQAKQRFDTDEHFAKKARERVVRLQAGDEESIKLWAVFLKESLKHCHEIYKILGVRLIDRGESFYNDKLPQVVQDMKQQSCVEENQGAVCYFSKTFKNREGEPQPLIIQKSDGGYNYATTDLAAIRYRVDVTQAKRIIYITDIRQAQHFAMVFEAARNMGWAQDTVELTHIGYGMILNKDRKPFKTRSGDNVHLRDVISEAIKRSQDILEQSGRSFTAEEQSDIAQKVGLAAVKYYDLSHSLAGDYVFDWDNMLAMEGNTGPYMLYAYARLSSIVRKASDLNLIPGMGFETQIKSWHIEHESEMALVKTILKFSDEVHHIAHELKPNILTDYLYNLCKVFNTFYDKKSGVSVLDAKTDLQRQSRLALCVVTAKILKQGLGLLSIDVTEKM